MVVDSLVDDGDETMMSQLTDEYNDDAVNVNRSTCDAGRRIKCRDNIYRMKSMIKGCQTIMQVRKTLDHINVLFSLHGEYKVSSMKNTIKSQNISCTKYKM